MRVQESIQSDNSRLNRIQRGLCSLLDKPFFLALFLNLLSFLIRITFFDIKYEVSDDYMTDALLSGAFGNGYEPNLLFGNPILGHLLVLLYKLIPQISFYFVLLVALGFVSVTAILYVLFKKNNCITAKVLAVLFLVFYTDDLYILVQFTKVSTVAGIAGGLLVLYALWEEKQHRVRLFVIGTLITVMGSMVRFTTIYIYAFFLVLTFIIYTCAKLKKETRSSVEKGQKKGITKETLQIIGCRFMACVLLIGLLFGLHSLGTWMSNRDSEHKAFNDFHAIRCNISDVGIPEYDEVRQDYERLGLDQVDYLMLGSWSFGDREVYSDDVLEQVGQAHMRVSEQHTTSFSYVLKSLIDIRLAFYWAAIGLYLIVGLSLLLSKNRSASLIMILATIVILGVFLYTGRTLYRVEWSAFFCGAACILTLFEFDMEASIAKYKKTCLGKERLMIEVYLVVLIIGLLVTRAMRILPDQKYSQMSDEDYIVSAKDSVLNSIDYLPEKYVFPSSDRKLFLNITNRMENDSEHFYFVDFFTGIQSMYFAYDPWIRPEEDLFLNYCYFGSVAMHHPGEEKVLDSNGMDHDSPYKDLVKDNVYLVDNEFYYPKLAYIKKYYYPDATIELVDEVDGFMIWKIYVPQEDTEQ